MEIDESIQRSRPKLPTIQRYHSEQQAVESNLGKRQEAEDTTHDLEKNVMEKSSQGKAAYKRQQIKSSFD